MNKLTKKTTSKNIKNTKIQNHKMTSMKIGKKPTKNLEGNNII